MNKYVPGAVSGFVFAACTTAQFAPSKLNANYPVRTQPPAIEVFRSSVPPAKFIEIGALNACCSVDPNSMIDVLRERASQNGGDAIMALEFNAQGAASATVIRFDDVSSQP